MNEQTKVLTEQDIAILVEGLEYAIESYKEHDRNCERTGFNVDIEKRQKLIVYLNAKKD